MKTFFKSMALLLPLLFLTNCSNDDDASIILPLDSITYDLSSVSDPGISGSATVINNLDGSVTVDIQLNGTTSGEMHPAHIHNNTAAEGGAIAVSLTAVNGATGFSSTTFSALDDGSSIDYTSLLAFDGYINVHLSSDNLDTLVAQGDIGQNDLTGTEKIYALGSVDVDGIIGTATFSERNNGEALATIALSGTPNGGMHPGHIHFNTAAEGGAIAFTFNPVDGTSGISRTNVAALDDDSSFGYNDVLVYDGYINIHLSADDLGTLVAQGDIGQNELTGNEKIYALGTVDVAGISGTATFSERINGEALATIALDGTPDGGMHPGHIHFNTAVEGGAIAFTFNPVDGSTGISKTNVATLDDDSSIGYNDILAYDGYINIHLSADDLGTLVAQGDIGQNELTGESVAYGLATVDVPGISGIATFFQRVNNEALAVLTLEGTPNGGMHPAHIHMGSVATAPGDILFTFTPVNGTTGISMTNVAVLDNDAAFGYSDVLDVDGYINVHLSVDELPILIAQGNIGSNQ